VSDVTLHAPFNLKWELSFEAKSAGATLAVNISAPKIPLPPPPPTPPPPTPAPCSKALCGAVAVEAKGEEIDLSSVGTSDWTHYGLGNTPKAVNRKCEAGTLIQPLKVTDGAMSSFNNDGMTYSWKKGGFEPGTPAVAQLGSASSTPDAVWSSAAKGRPAGGFEFAIDIPAVEHTTNVYLYMGVSGNLPMLNVTLLGADGVAAGSYAYTAPNGKGPYFIATLTVPAAKTTAAAAAAAGKRTLSGTWTQVASQAVGTARNIQFHSIAVDAGGVVAGGAAVACSHGAADSASGEVILQAATLTSGQ
jgi:hypothetical protein